MTRCSKILAVAAVCAACTPAFAQPANDHCADAIEITDGDTTYDLSEAETDGNSASTGFGMDTKDIWFTYTATATGSLEVYTCARPNFYALVAIYNPVCTPDVPDELSSGWVGSDTSCSPGNFVGDAITNVVIGQHVLIKVCVLFGSVSPGPNTLHVEVSPPLTSCIVVPSGAVEEGEPCGANNNGNCDVAQDIAAPVTVHGTMWAASGGDEDYYHVHVTQPSVLTASMICDLPQTSVGIYNSGGCTGLPPISGIFPTYIGPRCTQGQASAIVSPGDYYIKVYSQAINGFPCGYVNDYVLHVEAAPLGACCVAGGCSLKAQADCASLGGTYQGDGVACQTYTAASSGSAYEDISATGIHGPDSPDPSGGASAAHVVVNLGFSFIFYGNRYSEVSINTDGFLQFGPDYVDDTATFNTPLPNNGVRPGGPASPRNAICGLWDALATDTAPPDYNGQGHIVYQTLGTAPNRRFIAQWIDVGQLNFFPLAPEGIPVNFQIVLFEGTNKIECRYGNLTPDVNSDDYTIGVQEALGIIGTNVDSASIGSGNTAITLTPGNSACPTCIADFNHSNTVSVQDIFDFLSAWFAVSPSADINFSGAVTVQDIFDFLAHWFSGC